MELMLLHLRNIHPWMQGLIGYTFPIQFYPFFSNYENMYIV